MAKTNRFVIKPVKKNFKKIRDKYDDNEHVKITKNSNKNKINLSNIDKFIEDEQYN